VPRPDYPRSIVEFQRRFPDEEACRRYLFESRWPEGYRCPRCGSPTAFALERRLLWQCADCRYQVSVTAGTVLHRTRTPLHLWFWAAYLMATATPGISALQLQRQLGLGRYETAWMMLHKLRRAMVAPERTPLRGPVEVDESFVGGPEAGRDGRFLGDKELVVAAVEIRGAGSGRVRMQVIEDASSPNLTGFVTANVSPAATVHTDGWTAYLALTGLGYDHRPLSQRAHRLAGGDPNEVMPRAHRAFSHLKTWLRGTHRGVSGEHLPAYLDEFVFRWNRRRTPMAAFQTLLGLGGKHEPTTYREIKSTHQIWRS